MSASDISAAHAAPEADTRANPLRAIFTLISIGRSHSDLVRRPSASSRPRSICMAISAFMILAWMTNIMEYGAAGLIGCLLFWTIGGAKIETAFSGFVNDTPWFLFGADSLGAAATDRAAATHRGFCRHNVGSSYSRLLLGLIVTSFVLTLIVPSGAARLVVMASIALGWSMPSARARGSNIGRGIFLVITYTAAIFDKMVIAGAGAITAVGNITRFGGVDVSYGLWFLAFLPCALLTIVAAWWFAMKVYPPEVTSLEGRMDRLRAELKTKSGTSPLALKATALSLLALGMWLTDYFHHIPPSVIALSFALIAFLPFVNVLNAEDMAEGQSACRSFSSLRRFP